MSVDQGYSSKVDLTLVVQGTQLALSHVGPRWVIVSDQCASIPPTEAELQITVDDSLTQQKIFLPEGVRGPGELTPFSKVAS